MQRRAKTWGRLVVCAVLAIGLQACALAGVAIEAPPDIYVLTTPDSKLGADRPRLSLLLVVDEPYAPAALDSNRIVYQPSPNEISYFANARWSDRVPQMVQVLLVDTLDRSGKFQAVGRRAAGMRSDYLVRLSILTFGAEAGSTDAETVRVVLNAQLVRRFSDEIVAGRRFETVAQPEGRGMINVIGAFDRAASAALGDIAVWIYDEAVRATLAPEG
ncbi:MAG: hypothetical protein COA62_04545 [Rhodobiaceae bacterium]|nr:MAG: hypothetical protein COA62_04545 [Rhodobiaceae bacterium]